MLSISKKKYAIRNAEGRVGGKKESSCLTPQAISHPAQSPSNPLTHTFAFLFLFLFVFLSDSPLLSLDLPSHFFCLRCPLILHLRNTNSSTFSIALCFIFGNIPLAPLPSPPCPPPASSVARPISCTSWIRWRRG